MVEMDGRAIMQLLITNIQFKQEGPGRSENLNTDTAGKTDEVTMTTVLHYFTGATPVGLQGKHWPG